MTFELLNGWHVACLDGCIVGWFHAFTIGWLHGWLHENKHLDG